MSDICHTQVLLLGNGLNRAYDGYNWAGLVDILHSDH